MADQGPPLPSAGPAPPSGYASLVTVLNQLVQGQGRVIQAIAAIAGATGTAGGDLSGTYPDPSVVKLQGRAVSSGAPTSGYVLTWSGTEWAASAATSAPSGAAGGDLSGTYPNPSVAKLQGNAVASGAPTTGYVLTWSGTQWAAAPATSAPSGSAGGDLGSTYPNPTVTATHLASPLPLAQGGLAATTAAGGRGTLALNIVEFSFWYSGAPGNGATAAAILGYAYSLPASMTGSYAISLTAATSSATFAVNKISGGTTTLIGNITFAGSGTTGSFPASSLTSFSTGDIIEIVAPNPADATLANIGITLMLTRT